MEFCFFLFRNCSIVRGSYWTKNIADAVLDILENWGLDNDKRVAVTTDNGSNVVVAFRNIAVLRVSCFGHNLDLAIKKVLGFPRVQQA